MLFLAAANLLKKNGLTVLLNTEIIISCYRQGASTPLVHIPPEL